MAAKFTVNGSRARSRTLHVRCGFDRAGELRWVAINGQQGVQRTDELSGPWTQFALFCVLTLRELAVTETSMAEWKAEAHQLWKLAEWPTKGNDKSPRVLKGWVGQQKERFLRWKKPSQSPHWPRIELCLGCSCGDAPEQCALDCQGCRYVCDDGSRVQRGDAPMTLGAPDLERLDQLLLRLSSGSPSHVELEQRSAADILISGIVDRAPQPNSPARVLTAGYQAVEFVPSVWDSELERIQTWLDSSELNSVQLVTGPGGAGKTRLFIELATRQRMRGWNAGFLPPQTAEADLLKVLGAAQPTLVILDYAETRQGELSQVLARAVANSRPAASKLRVALLARHVGDWWNVLHLAAPAVVHLLEAHAPVTLRPAHVSVERRREVFEKSLAGFARVLQPANPPLLSTTLPDLSHERFGRVLFVAMAALASLQGSSLDSPDALSPEKLLGTILAHEKRYLKLQFYQDTHADAIEQGDFLRRSARLLAAATLRGRIATKLDAELVSRNVAGPKRTRPRLALVVLHNLYGGPSGYLLALTPDLLGEQLVREVLADIETPADYLERVLAGADAAAVRECLVVLGRIQAQRPSDRVREYIRALLTRDVRGRALAAIEAAASLSIEAARSGLADALHEALRTHGDAQLARELHDRIPMSTVGLGEVACWVVDTLLAKLPALRTGPRGALLQNSSIRLTQVGRHEESLLAAREAVECLRAAATSSGSSWLPLLASSLLNLGTRLGEAGRPAESLQATEEAVAHLRALAGEANAVQLAAALNGMAISLSQLGRHEEALAAARAAVDHFRGLPKLQLDRHLGVFATCLDNLGARLSALGHRKEALAAAREAADHHRCLAAMRPDACLPPFASALTNLGMRLAELGHHEEALSLTEEAVVHYRALAHERSDVFLPGLAMSLNNLGLYLSFLGRPEKALAATKEAVGHYCTLVQTRPEQFSLTSAVSIDNLGNQLAELGHWEEALAATSGAVETLRALAQSHSEAALPHLAASLNNLGKRFTELTRHEEALNATREAVGHYRELARARPEMFVPGLASGLRNLAIDLQQLGRTKELAAVLVELSQLIHRRA